MTTSFTGFAGRRADGKLIKTIIPQFDGSRFASGNCAAASEAVRDRVEAAARTVTGQPWPPNGATIRSGTGDMAGGLTPYQTTGVSRREYRIGNDIRIVDWSVVYKKLRNGFAVVLLVQYRPISNAGKSGSPGFMGTHSITLLGIRGSGSDIEILYSDSLCDGRRAGIPEGPIWIRIRVLKDAASQLVINVGDGTTLRQRYGLGKAYVSFGITGYDAPPEPPTKPIPGAVRFDHPRRVRMLYQRTNLRERPRKNPNNVVRLLDKGDRFDAYWHIENDDGRWLGNKAKTRWVWRKGTKFVKYI